MGKLKIIMDGFGGDNSPEEVLKGAAMAVAELGVEIALCGSEPGLREAAAREGVSLDGIGIVHAEGVIPVEESPSEILKSYANCSMATGFKLLANGQGDAFVTAGSTGAAVVGATMLVKRIKGIKRAAIATMIPAANDGRYMLLDMGANAECRPEMLVQFGIMGSAYMERLMQVPSPRVGLINIGTEETKGLELQIEAYKLLKEAPLNFVGNVEARELNLGGCDVAVCDGFTGNVILKLTEGMGKMMTGELKRMLLSGTMSKIAAGLLKGQLTDFKKRMDYTEYGGAPLLGIAKPVIKAHGSSNAKAFKNAVRQAKLVCENKVIERIQDVLEK